MVNNEAVKTRFLRKGNHWMNARELKKCEIENYEKKTPVTSTGNQMIRKV